MNGDVSPCGMRARLRDAFVWRGDRTDDHRYADVTGWWRRPDLLRDLGPALAGLFAGSRPTVVLGPADIVLLVDDWVDTGGQALGARGLTEDAGATWLGVASVVDALGSNEVRRRLNVRALLHMRDL